jgi:oxygen-dependent protoporphyrinogen oxidase
MLAEPVAPRAPRAEESVAAFARRRFGRAAGALAELAASGVFAGDPDRLSLAYAFPRLAALEARHGSILRAIRRARRAAPVRKTTCAPRSGMDAIAARLAAGVTCVRSCHRLAAIRRRPDGWTLDLATLHGRLEAVHDAILLAVPAQAYRGLALPDELWPLAALGDVRHASVAVLALGFRRGDVAHPLDGFGALVPASEGRATLGVIFSSSLFPDRAPEGHVLLTAVAGGVRRPALATLDDAALEATILGNLAALVGVSAAPVFRRITRWSDAIPQPELGHGRFLAVAEDVERSVPAVAVAGTWRDGVAVTDALASGVAAAERLAARLGGGQVAASHAAGGVA